MNNEVYTRVCNELENLRVSENPYWNAGPKTVDLIISYIKNSPQCRALEVGTSNGYTALRLVPALIEVGGTLTTIESHKERGELAEHHFRCAEVEDTITLVHGHAPEIFDSLTGVFDLIFFDATKYEHVSYVTALLPFMNQACVVIADNIHSHEEAMKPFIEYMYSLAGFSVEILSIETGILVARKEV
ncbi:MAG TPA: class I SAM-dependent methyltransferase [Candidatus Magasanikbacteria bacterium]|nr:class I SAM-dependent methyltransferase [Candidatus Magasanikbacteria bacterium]